MTGFAEKKVLVTGGNSGIGLAAAQAFSAAGATVAITGRDQSTLDSSARSIGGDVLSFRSDASSLRDIDALVERLDEDWGRVDSVFINAGVVAFGPFGALDEAAWQRSFDINAKGPYFLIQRIVRLMPPGSTIVLNGSVNAHIGMAGSSIYAASKAALMSLARTLSTELLSKGIRVNVVSPGPISTPLYGRLGLSEEDLAVTAADIQSQIPLGRFGEPAEVVSAVLYLASPESSFVVGSELVVDGGMTRLSTTLCRGRSMVAFRRRWRGLPVLLQCGSRPTSRELSAGYTESCRDR